VAATIRLASGSLRDKLANLRASLKENPNDRQCFFRLHAGADDALHQ
jgi:hypothetical protein